MTISQVSKVARVRRLITVQRLGLFYSVIASMGAHATDCKDIRLDQNGLSMSNVSTKNQHSRGICWSVASSELYDAYLQSSGVLNANTSGLYTGIEQRLSSIDQSEKLQGVGKGGDPYEALQYLLWHGGCRAEYVEKNIEPSFDDEVYTTLQKYYRSHAFSSSAKNKFQIPEIPVFTGPEWTHIPKFQPAIGFRNQILVEKYNERMSTANVAACIQKNDPLNQLLGRNANLPLELAQQALAAKSEEEFFARLKKIVTPCPNAFRLRPPAGKKVQVIRADNHKNDVETIRQQLLMPNPLPVLITYCFYNYASRLVKLIAAENKCGPHASLIIGMRKSNQSGKCEYLIRNSYGDTNMLDDGLTYKRGLKTEAGGFWTDEATLKKALDPSLGGIVYLKSE